MFSVKRWPPSSLSLWLVLLVVQSQQAASQSEREQPEGCEDEQYFSNELLQCRACSEAVRLFDLSRPLAEPGASQSAVSAPSQPQQQPPAPLVGLVRLPQSRSDKPRRQQSFQERASSRPPSVLLSRLISVEPAAAAAAAAARDYSEEEGEAAGARQLDGREREDDAAAPAARRANLAAQDQDQPGGETTAFVEPTAAGGRRSQELAEEQAQAVFVLPARDGPPAGAAECARLARLQVASLTRDLARRSLGLERTALLAIGQCRQNNSLAACQQWSNLCTLTMYAHSDSAGAARAAGLRERAGEPGGSWQRCADFSLVSICNSLREWHRLERPADSEQANIFMELNSSQPDEEAPLELVAPADGSAASSKATHEISMKLGSLIQLIVYKYSFEGHLLEVRQFDLRDMANFACASLGLASTTVGGRQRQHQLKVGNEYKQRCSVEADQLRAFVQTTSTPSDLNETQFFDLFIGHSSAPGGAFIKPVPIIIRNLLYNNQLVNLKHSANPNRWRPVRRFFYHSQAQIGQQRTLVSFVTSAHLELKFRRHRERTGGFLLSSIQLHLDYGHTVMNTNLDAAHKQQQQQRAQWTNGSQTLLASEVVVSQSLWEMQTIRKDLDLLISILSILSCLWSLIKCYNIQKYQSSPIVRLDLQSLFVFLLLSCDLIANLLALVTLGLALYLFALFKLSSDASASANNNNNHWQLFGPDQELELAMLFNLKLALLFKLIGLARKCYLNVSVDLFFVDWERPKMLTSMQMLQHYHFGQHKARQTSASGAEDSSGGANISAQQQQQQQISFWRPYTVINRWLKMITLRRCTITGRLVAFVCLVECGPIAISSLSCMAPNWRWPPPAASNSAGLSLGESGAFRALTLALLYLGLALGQWAYKRLVHEPMVRNSTREFVDLCSVANVSLFAMLHPRYGFYVHGRNANGSADCSLVEMNALLEREERGLCSRRGLAANSDQQVFVMLLPRIISDHYRRLLMRYEPSSLAGGSGGARAAGQLLAGGNSLIKSALSISQQASLGLAGGGGNQALVGTPTWSSWPAPNGRALMETIVARNRAINLFLTNFLDHIYKDIDYSIRERRRFEGLLVDQLDEEDSATAAAAQRQEAGAMGSMLRLSAGQSGAPNSVPALSGAEHRASFCFDRSSTGSFAQLLLLGLELDLVLCELLCLLLLDHWLGAQQLLLSAGLLWLGAKLFEWFYWLCARENLIAKSMLDEKFLARA